MDKKFLDLDKQFDEAGNITVILQIDTELIRKGILKNLTSTQLKVLLAVASHMDDNGEAFPSMRYISEVAGVALSTVNTAINGLLELRIDGLPIITRTVEGTGARKKSKYNFAIDIPVIDEVTKRTPKNFLDMFFDKYLEVYSVKYKVSGARDMKSIKSMMKVYTDLEIEIIISTVITEYSKRWSNVKYPAPTIGAMAGWLCVQALQINSNKVKPQESKWDDIESSDEDLIL